MNQLKIIYTFKRLAPNKWELTRECKQDKGEKTTTPRPEFDATLDEIRRQWWNMPGIWDRMRYY